MYNTYSNKGMAGMKTFIKKCQFPHRPSPNTLSKFGTSKLSKLTQHNISKEYNNKKKLAALFSKYFYQIIANKL
jgi:hypothetical protein